MPKPHVMTCDQSGIKSPRKLGRHGGQLWKTVMNEYQIDDAGGLEMLASACQALDRAERCREAIDDEEETTRRHRGLTAGVARDMLLTYDLAIRELG
jgi:hypothetical protein